MDIKPSDHSKYLKEDARAEMSGFFVYLMKQLADYSPIGSNKLEFGLIMAEVHFIPDQLRGFLHF
jgi:hypothetical protein